MSFGVVSRQLRRRRLSLEEILRTIDQFTEPSIMSKEEALEYLGEIQAELDMRREVLRQEIAAEGT